MTLPEAQVGDRFEVAHGRRGLRVRQLQVPRARDAADQARETDARTREPADKDDLSIASYNVENLSAVNDAERMPAIARQIIDNLRSPDILALNEMQDLDGEGPLGPAGDPTFQALVAAIAAEGGPSYEYRQIDPVHNQDGGAPNANIRVGFLFNPARVQFVDRPGRHRGDGDRGRPSAVGRAADVQPGPDRPDEHGLELEPQAAGR